MTKTESTTVVGAVPAIWFPTFTFVAIGFDHCVANMYYLTLGLMLGMEGEHKTFLYDAVWRNLVPATLGNILGGALFVGGVYWCVGRHVVTAPLAISDRYSHSTQFYWGVLTNVYIMYSYSIGEFSQMFT
eukprot:5593788-Pyramimonas_sp.AAC.1